MAVWVLSVSLVISGLFFGSRETFQKNVSFPRLSYSLCPSLDVHSLLTVVPLLPGRPAPLAPCILRSTIPNQAPWHKEAVQISGLDGINPGASLLGRLSLGGTEELPTSHSEIPHQFKETISKATWSAKGCGKTCFTNRREY